ncbi:MAG: class I SAM-dependent methyltransferase [Candidatus Lokiarchaeota archaeon]|nr:class I SAM-dependent methyltransferase [Candidatus Lokiarchaeota archaeon]
MGQNFHKLFEIDLPVIIHYKETLLKDFKSLCYITRVPADLSDDSWINKLMEKGFSTDLQTFWILEGLIYYIEKEKRKNLLTVASQISPRPSQIFLDMLHITRWYDDLYASNGLFDDPFSKHIKWGINIKNTPSFMAKTGWLVECSFAEEHDMGRNAGQKGFLFVQGIKK